MTSQDVMTVARIGRTRGPVALAALHAITAAGGTWDAGAGELAGVIGATADETETALSGLAADGVIAYSPSVTGGVYSVGVGTTGQEAAPAVPKRRKPLPTDPLFDAIAVLVGPVAAKAANGRVAKLANQMLKAGLTAERLAAEFHGTWRAYYPWKKVLDLDTVTACWPAILNPPQVVGSDKPSAVEMARKATANGNPWAKTG